MMNLVQNSITNQTEIEKQKLLLIDFSSALIFTTIYTPKALVPWENYDCVCAPVSSAPERKKRAS